MPYLIFILGLLLGVYSIYWYFIRADVTDLKVMFQWVLLSILGLALLYLSLTGKLIAALFIFVALVLIAISSFKERSPKAKDEKPDIIDVTPIDEDDQDSDT